MKGLQERILKRHKRDKKTELKERLEAYRRRKEYERDYALLHKDKRREYNRLWTQKKRADMKKQGIVEKKYKKPTGNPVGRPRMNLTEEERKERRDAQIQQYTKRSYIRKKMTKQRPDVRYYFEINHIPNTEYPKGAIIEARQLEHSKGVAFSITYLTKDKKWEIKSGEEVNDMINKGYIKYLKDYKHKPAFFQN